MPNKILLIGPFPDPISGVSLANNVVEKLLSESDKYKTDIINTSYPFFDEFIGDFSFRKLIFFLSLNLKSFKIFRAQIIYMTPGQTFFGVAKYSLFILLSKLLNKTTIIHVHGNHLGSCYDNLKGIKKKIFYLLISSFSKGIVLSKSLRNNLTPFINHKLIFELPNFAEDYLIENKNPLQSENLKIIFLSNLMYEKGITFFLESLRLLEEKGIYYEAKIAGNIDVNLKQKIERTIKKLDNAAYLGVVKGQAKKDLLQWSNTFVLPTFYKMEGQPISILEALATKNIIITTEHAGIKDVIKNKKNGFFVQKKNAQSITNKLIYLSENLNKVDEISEENLLYFKNNFTLGIFKKKILKIFDE